MTSEEWLSRRAPGFRELPVEDRQAIMDFALLWSLFEAKVLENSANPDRIRAKVDRWTADGTLATDRFEGAFGYFRDRYFDGQAFTYHFDHLHFRNNDHPDVVKAAISGASGAPRDRMLALLMIVWRLRNNLFHGMKWAYGVQGQLDNFRHANDILMKLLELHAEVALEP